jgi:hypothetical protein
MTSPLIRPRLDSAALLGVGLCDIVLAEGPR